MKLYLEKAILVNRVPFDKLELSFNENEIAVLSGVNGRGKTTILSHIADAFYEMAKPYFRNEFGNKGNALYRVSSPFYNLNFNAPSFVYLRFKTPEESIDYVDINNPCTETQYNEAITIDNKIPFNQLQQALKENRFSKKVSSNFNKDKADNFFSNILTYFPSYRYEQPSYLTDPYKINLDFKKESGFSGTLNNPIEVISGLPQLANWIMDVVLDNQYLNLNEEDIKEILAKLNFQFETPLTVSDLINYIRQNAPNLIYNILNMVIHNKSEIKRNIDLILTKTLISKQYGNLRFGVGLRNFGSKRIQIVKGESGEQIYPSIFNISSGEASILCLFGELLRQADNNRNNIPLSEITGIVLVDEVDKHLHIRLQKEVLPELFKLFPNVQFIVSSHSPFLSMGLSEKAFERSKIVDLDNKGISKNPTTNDLYIEVYNMMVSENERFKEMYESLEQKIKEGTKPLIITEGKTDIQHIRKAREKLNITDLEIDFFEIPEEGLGDSKLKTLLENLSKLSQTRKVIGIFDRDNPAILADVERDNQSFKNYGNNIFAFCIPIPKGREKYTNISIEFYYTDSELKKEKDGRRLYFDNEVEFRQSVSNKQDRKLIRLDNAKIEVLSKKVVDEKNMCNLAKWIHSKSEFANLVEKDIEFTRDFDFTNFNLIFDKIREIINF